MNERDAQGAPLTEADPAADPVGQETVDAGPVGAGERVVRQGDCISSIACETGHFWETIWNDAANSELREARRNPNVLLPGDRVQVPELERKAEPGQTEMRHRFKRLGEPAMLRFQVRNSEGNPLACVGYELAIAGVTYAGATDAAGEIQCPIRGDAADGLLRLENGRQWRLQLGWLDPASENSGCLGRLVHLGHLSAIEAGADELRDAILAFQQHERLPASGELDLATRDRLTNLHGY